MLVSPAVPTPAPAQAASRAHGPFPRGEHGFEVVSAEGRASERSGAPMIALQPLVRSEDGHRRAVFDHLPPSERALWKTESIAAAVGLLELHKSGAMGASDLGAKTGRPPLDVRPASEECGAQRRQALSRARCGRRGAAGRARARPHGRLQLHQVPRPAARRARASLRRGAPARPRPGPARFKEANSAHG